MFVKAYGRHAGRLFSTLRLGPEKPSSCVIFLHGLGDTAEGWLHGAHFLAASLPQTRFLLPTAPIQPVSLNGGMAMPSWYDIRGLGERADEPCDGIEESRKTVEGLIQEQLDAGMTSERIILAGFSQGGGIVIVHWTVIGLSNCWNCLYVRLLAIHAKLPPNTTSPSHACTALSWLC